MPIIECKPRRRRRRWLTGLFSSAPRAWSGIGWATLTRQAGSWSWSAAQQRPWNFAWMVTARRPRSAAGETRAGSAARVRRRRRPARRLGSRIRLGRGARLLPAPLQRAGRLLLLRGARTRGRGVAVVRRGGGAARGARLLLRRRRRRHRRRSSVSARAKKRAQKRRRANRRILTRPRIRRVARAGLSP